MQKPYYKKTNFELYQANSLEFLAELPENSVDMIFADPPYFLSSGSFSCQNGRMVSVKKGDWDMCNGTKKNFEFHLAWLKPNASPNLSCRFFTASHKTLIWARHFIQKLKYAINFQYRFSYSI